MFNEILSFHHKLPKKSMVVFLLFFNFLGNIRLGHAGCPNSWQGNSSLSSCYIYVSVTMKVANARQYCYDEHKAVLAMPKTEEENNFLKSINIAEVFIGMTDIYDEGSFEYFDGDSVQATTAMFSYNPWDTSPGLAWTDHVVMTVAGTWKYASAVYKRAFWCQKDFTISDSCTDLGWFKDPYEDICYKSFGDGTYNEAVNACETSGYDILMPKSMHQHKFLRWFISEYINDNVWIGLTDKEQEGTFKWHAGIDTDFRAFANGEPDDLLNDQDCVRYDGTYNKFEWNDWLCTSSNPTIVCQAFESNVHTSPGIPSITPYQTARHDSTTHEITTPDIPDSTEATTLFLSATSGKSTTKMASTSDVEFSIKSSEKSTTSMAATSAVEFSMKTSEKSTTNMAATSAVEFSTESSEGRITSVAINTTSAVVLYTVSSSMFSTVSSNGLCLCSCAGANIPSDISSYLAKLQQELKVEVKTLSSTIRSKTCADDPRQSAKNIGFVGVFVLATIFTAIVLIDAISFITSTIYKIPVRSHVTFKKRRGRG